VPSGIAPLNDADERLHHQISNSFSTANSSDLGWTEKVWLTMVSEDGGVQADFGLGKYLNRDVLDGFAGVSRGREQWTLRASRELHPDSLSTAVRPLHYEVIEPLNAVRVSLAPNDVVNVSFDLTFTAVLPAFFEDRDVQYHRGRQIMDVVRWHQAGRASGWIDIDGQRIQVDATDWFAFRDRSWGVRQYVGVPPPDLAPNNTDWLAQRFHFNWLPSQISRPDGSRYDLHYYFRDTPAGNHLTGHINEPDGTQLPLRHVIPELRYAEDDRRLLGGEVRVIVDDARATERVFTLTPIGDRTGFRLWPALYYPWKGLTHGTWKGRLHVDGEYIPDCPAAFDAVANPIWQTCDRPIRITGDDAAGFAILESNLIGSWPDLTCPA
jgi:hypothetical protein